MRSDEAIFFWWKTNLDENTYSDQVRVGSNIIRVVISIPCLFCKPLCSYTFMMLQMQRTHFSVKDNYLHAFKHITYMWIAASNFCFLNISP